MRKTIAVTAAMLALTAPASQVARADDEPKVQRSITWYGAYDASDRASTGPWDGIAHKYPQVLNLADLELGPCEKYTIQTDHYDDTAAAIDALTADGVLTGGEDNKVGTHGWTVSFGVTDGCTPEPEPTPEPTPTPEPPTSTPTPEVPSPPVTEPPVQPEPTPTPAPKPVVKYRTVMVQVDAYRPKTKVQRNIVSALALDGVLKYREDRALWGANTWRIVTLKVPTTATAPEIVATAKRVTKLPNAYVWELGKGATAKEPWGTRKNVPQVFLGITGR